VTASPRHVVIVGLMGSGKSTLARGLADELERPVVDSDEQLRRSVERTAREIAESDGLATLHRIEADLLLGSLGDPGPAVIAAAASTIEDDRCREAMQAADVFVIWLRGSVETLASRVLSSRHRPLIADDPAKVLAAQMDAREPLFATVADAVIDIDGASREEVRTAALALLNAPEEGGED
jgi:shikimate kinase